MKKLKRLFISRNARRISCFTAAGAGFMGMGSLAQAQVIVSDNFSSATTTSSTYGITLNGAAVSTGGTNTNLTGNNYINAGGYNNGDRAYDRGGQSSGNNPGLSVAPANYAGFDPTGGVAIVLGTYNTGSLTVTGDILGYAQGYNEGTPGTISPVLASAYSLVGFSSRTTAAGNYGGQTPITLFSGLEATGLGSLQEYVNGATVGSAIAYGGGTYSATSPAILQYTLNTTTGAISNVSFGSSTANYSAFASAPGGWLSADSSSVVLGGTGGQSNTQSQIGSYSVAEVVAVPEPSSYLLLAGGLLTLGAFQRGRQRNQI